MNDVLKVDGSFGEGGGAILRLSAGYSVLFNQPIHIRNIRANRSKPGLRLQHLLGLRTLASLVNGSLSSCQVGTKEIYFTPSQHLSKTISINVDTAASIGLLLQPIQIACMGLSGIEKIELSLKGGGTFGKWAPSINYLQEVTWKIFERLGLKIELEIDKHGWYPKGGARISCNIFPPNTKLKPLNLTELGKIDMIKGEITVTNQLKRSKMDIPKRIDYSIRKKIKQELDLEADLVHSWVESDSPGVGLNLWASSSTGSIISSGTFLGEKHLSSEELGRNAAMEIIKYIKNDVPVDNYLSDQLIPMMAYVKEPSSIKVLEITSHAKTNLELVKLFTHRNYNINKEKDGYIIGFK